MGGACNRERSPTLDHRGAGVPRPGLGFDEHGDDVGSGDNTMIDGNQLDRVSDTEELGDRTHDSFVEGAATFPDGR